jgi:hypothetical protein
MSQFIIKFSHKVELNNTILRIEDGYVAGERAKTGFRIWAKHFRYYFEAEEAIQSLSSNQYWLNCNLEIEQLD